eukprot:15352464-Alexandrium_andersonii.AAC.1
MGPSRAPETDSELVSGLPSPPSPPPPPASSLALYSMVATMAGYHYLHHDSNRLPETLKGP